MSKPMMDMRIESLGRRRRARRLGLDPVAAGVESAKVPDQVDTAEAANTRRDASGELVLS